MTLLPYYVLQHMAVIGSELKVRTKATLTRKNIKSDKFNKKSIIKSWLNLKMNKLELKELSKKKNKDLILIDKKSYKNQAKVSKISTKKLVFFIT